MKLSGCAGSGGVLCSLQLESRGARGKAPMREVDIPWRQQSAAPPRPVHLLHPLQPQGASAAACSPHAPHELGVSKRRAHKDHARVEVRDGGGRRRAPQRLQLQPGHARAAGARGAAGGCARALPQQQQQIQVAWGGAG